MGESHTSIFISMFSGMPWGVMVMKGMEKGTSVRAERSILVRSAKSLMRCIATGSVERSSPVFALKSSRTKWIIMLSKSSPPRKMSPPVALVRYTVSAATKPPGVRLIPL